MGRNRAHRGGLETSRSAYPRSSREATRRRGLRPQPAEYWDETADRGLCRADRQRRSRTYIVRPRSTVIGGRRAGPDGSRAPSIARRRARHSPGTCARGIRSARAPSPTRSRSRITRSAARSAAASGRRWNVTSDSVRATIGSDGEPVTGTPSSPSTRAALRHTAALPHALSDWRFQSYVPS